MEVIVLTNALDAKISICQTNHVAEVKAKNRRCR